MRCALTQEEKGYILHDMRGWCRWWCRGGNMSHDESAFFIFFRCTSLRNKYGSCQQLNNGTKENLILPPEQSPGNGKKPGNECLYFPLFPKAYSSTFFDIRPSPWCQWTSLKMKSPTRSFSLILSPWQAPQSHVHHPLCLYQLKQRRRQWGGGGGRETTSRKEAQGLQTVKTAQ